MFNVTGKKRGNTLKKKNRERERAREIRTSWVGSILDFKERERERERLNIYMMRLGSCVLVCVCVCGRDRETEYYNSAVSGPPPQGHAWSWNESYFLPRSDRVWAAEMSGISVTLPKKIRRSAARATRRSRFHCFVQVLLNQAHIVRELGSNPAGDELSGTEQHLQAGGPRVITSELQWAPCRSLTALFVLVEFQFLSYAPLILYWCLSAVASGQILFQKANVLPGHIRPSEQDLSFTFIGLTVDVGGGFIRSGFRL